MKTLYIDCGMGAAGDMLSAALLELIPDQEAFIEELNGLGIPGVVIAKEKAVKCGITGTHFTVKVHGEEEDDCMHGHTHHHGEQGHSHAYEHSHAHEHSHTYEHSHTHEQSQSHEHSHVHEHSHAHEHSYAHEHCHAHEHDHQEEHSHDHSHNHSHSHHHHSGMAEISHIISHLALPEKVKTDVLAVYNLIAQAESHVHGVPVNQIHFHEVGTMDAVADIVAVCLLMHRIHPDEVIASPVHVGSGNVHCAHGILPVPAPATAYILQDIPMYGGSIQGELCTPTGAALLKYFVSRFDNMPIMKVQKIGYGMGKKDFARANCVRVLMAETIEKSGQIVELNCNVDDMTGEAMGFAMEQLLAEGALEVYTVPVGMKKSRTGTLLCVLCREKDKEKMVQQIFKNTTTLGIRETTYNRYTLDRAITKVDTVFGEIRRKDSSGFGVTRSKYEYEDLARIARENDMSLAQVREKLGI